MIKALCDPDGAYLDRVQIIKGWLDAKGQTQEKVIDVAWSGDRKRDASGKVPLVGNTVDVKNATWTNTIGAPVLVGFWQDPEFDPALHAFYYVRVIEIPTPTWQCYRICRFSLPPCHFSVTLGRMKVVRLLLPLAICVPVGAVCGGLYALDVNPIHGAIGGAVIGLFAGLAFGGVERVVEFIYGPKDPDEDARC
jgi:hypothetical protein